MIRRPPRSTLFPYTNALPIWFVSRRQRRRKRRSTASATRCTSRRWAATKAAQTMGAGGSSKRRTRTRSEEHTSELQSQSNLVCRLLLEKKKTRQIDELTPIER